MGNRVLTTTFISLVVLVVASPALAKVVPTDTEVTVDGRTAIVTVDIDSHVGPGNLSEELDYMVALYPVSALDETGRPAPGDTGTPLEFQLVDDYTYRAVIEFPEGGEWAIVPFPFEPTMPADAYPSTTFTVADPGIPLLGIAGVALGVFLVSALVIWAAARGRRLQQSAPVTAPGASRA